MLLGKSLSKSLTLVALIHDNSFGFALSQVHVYEEQRYFFVFSLLLLSFVVTFGTTWVLAFFLDYLFMLYMVMLSINNDIKCLR